MGLRLQPRNCERARAWVSLRLDDEISDLEERLLEAHLRRCASCQEFEAIVRGAVLALRAEPLEQIEHPVVVSGRRRLPVGRGAVASVAAVAAAVVGVSAVLGTSALKIPSTHTPPPAPAAVAPDDQDLKQLRALRVLQLGGRPPRGAGVGSFGAVTNRQVGSD
ncbi:MAG: zf-HC2 domain-containing protein [Verrucomicrobiota bacterium]